MNELINSVIIATVVKSQKATIFVIFESISKHLKEIHICQVHDDILSKNF